MMAAGQMSVGKGRWGEGKDPCISRDKKVETETLMLTKKKKIAMMPRCYAEAW